MNNMTLYPAHSDAQVANAANAYQHSDLHIISCFMVNPGETRLTMI
jgi:hypothetical protein